MVQVAAENDRLREMPHLQRPPVFRVAARQSTRKSPSNADQPKLGTGHPSRLLRWSLLLGQLEVKMWALGYIDFKPQIQNPRLGKG
jgi:hypothetical protein